MKELFRLLNQLLLFLRCSPGLGPAVDDGEPGLSEPSVSDEDMVLRPRNLRTEFGRLPLELLPLGLAGVEWFSEEVVLRSCSVEFACLTLLEKVLFVGAGCESRGPRPGVGGRGESGESGGAGMGVPSVREKFTGVSVSGWYLPTAMVLVA